MNEYVASQFGHTLQRLSRDLATPPDLIDILPIAIYACDAAGRVLWFNRKAVELWGRVPAIGEDTERFCGSYRLYSLEGQPISREETPMARVLHTGEPVHGREARVERPDGSMVIAMVHIDPVHDAEGRLLGAINCFHDTTDLHRTREDMAANDALFRQILDALPAAVYTTDAEGTVTYYNPAAVDLAGRTPELGDKWCVTWKIYTPDGEFLPHDQCPMAVALRENRAVRGVEAVAERPDGSRRPFLPFPTPLRDAAGRLLGAVNMLVDISERKDAETQQKRLMAELNHRVKNNLQMLYALLSTSARSAGPDARSSLQDAAQRVGAMAAAQKVLYDAEGAISFSTEDFLQVLIENAQRAFLGRLQISHDADPGILSNDVCLPLALIANELLTNAAKHAVGDRDSAKVHVTLKQDTAAPGWLLTVRDDGPGFVPPQNGRRFAGLSLVGGLADQLGGSFSVRSDGGAVCTLRLGASPDSRPG